jgi:hypothetical protein
VAAPFDTLKLAWALRDRAGFSQEHAEAAADALAEAVSEQVATKQDVIDVRSEGEALRADIASALREFERRMTIRFGGMLIVFTGILLAAKSLG